MSWRGGGGWRVRTAEPAPGGAACGRQRGCGCVWGQPGWWWWCPADLVSRPALGRAQGPGYHAEAQRQRLQRHHHGLPVQGGAHHDLDRCGRRVQRRCVCVVWCGGGGEGGAQPQAPSTLWMSAAVAVSAGKRALGTPPAPPCGPEHAACAAQPAACAGLRATCCARHARARVAQTPMCAGGMTWHDCHGVAWRGLQTRARCPRRCACPP